MPVVHDLVSFYRGDQWVIDGFAADANGNPINLDTAEVDWILADMDGNRLVERSFGNGILKVDSATGAFLIIVTSDITAGVAAGKCQDFCRTVDPDNAAATQWAGLVRVLDSPFATPPKSQYAWVSLFGNGAMTTIPAS